MADPKADPKEVPKNEAAVKSRLGKEPEAPPPGYVHNPDYPGEGFSSPFIKKKEN